MEQVIKPAPTIKKYQDKSTMTVQSSMLHKKCRRTATITSTGNPLDYYGLRWLFDEDNPEHLSIEEKVLQFKPRDLSRTKLYACATNLFWEPPSRKRIIVVNSDYTRSTSNDDTVNQKPRTKPTSNTTAAKPAAPTFDILDDTKRVDEFEYRSWIAERKTLNSNIGLLGLNKDYLERKPNKTPIERSVLRKLIKEKQSSKLEPV